MVNPSLVTVQQSHRYGKPFATLMKDIPHAIEKGKYEAASLSKRESTVRHQKVKKVIMFVGGGW